MSRASVVAVLLLAAGVLLLRGQAALRLALLPELHPGVTTEVDTPVEAQRAAWAAFQTTLQCEVLDPCLSRLTISTWEGDPAAIARACGAAHARIEALPVPAELPPSVRRNAEHLRGWWRVETASHAAQAGASDVDPGLAARLLHGDLDTCTAESLPARLDQLYGLVPAGAPPATCAALQARGGAAAALPR